MRPSDHAGKTRKCTPLHKCDPKILAPLVKSAHAASGLYEACEERRLPSGESTSPQTAADQGPRRVSRRRHSIGNADRVRFDAPPYASAMRSRSARASSDLMLQRDTETGALQ